MLIIQFVCMPRRSWKKRNSEFLLHNYYFDIISLVAQKLRRQTVSVSWQTMPLFMLLNLGLEPPGVFVLTSGGATIK